MATETPEGIDSLTLRFVGENEDGTQLHELRAAHVAEVLQGVVGITSDFSKAGVFGDGPAGSEVLVRPAQEGSFIIEIVRDLADNAYVQDVVLGGIPSLSTIIWWATKSIRAEVSDYEHQDNGKVKVLWQDNTVDEIPVEAWDELNKRKRKRKKQLQQIMLPLSDSHVSSLEVSTDEAATEVEVDAPQTFVLAKEDYQAALPEDEIEETSEIFEVEAQMSAVDFDNADKWRVKTKDETRSATVEDAEFLGRIAGSLAIRKSDIFVLRIREDVVVKNGSSRTTWTILEVKSHRRAAADDDGDS